LFYTFTVGVVMHEAGHYLAFRMLSRKVIIYIGHITSRRFEVRTGMPGDYIGLRAPHRAYIYIAGVLLGLIPFAYLTIACWPFFIFIVPYLIGCRHDLKNLWRLIP